SDLYTPKPAIAVFICEGEKARRLELEGLEEGTDILNDAFVLSDGTVALGRGNLQLYDMETGKVAWEYEVHQAIWCMGGDDTFYCQEVSQQTQTLTMQKLPDGEISTLPVLKNEDGTALLSMLFAGTDGSLFYSTNKNLQQWTPGTTLWEELLTNEFDVFKYADFAFIDLYAEDDAFIAQALYQNERHIIRIVFDPDAPLTEKELTLAGMGEENELVQSVIAQFQQEHPGVIVQYRQMVGENAYSSKDDAYKVLNTEILAGEGPDLLLLEPDMLQTYAGQGILVPLEKQLQPLKDEMLPGLWQSCMDDKGNIYALPVAFHVWTLLAEKDAEEAFSSLHTLAAFAASQKTPVLPAEDWSQSRLFETMMLLYSDEFYAADGSFDAAKAETFLQDFKIIADQFGCSEWQTRADRNGYPQWPRVDRGSCEMSQGRALASLSRQQSQGEPFEIGLLRLHTAMTYNPNAKLSVLKNAYQPITLIGVNVNSKEPELAADFVSELIGHTDTLNFEEGTTVNKERMQRAVEDTAKVCESLDKYGAFGDAVFDGEDYMLQKAESEDVKPIVEMFLAVDKPIFIDQQLLDIELPVVKAYMEGEYTAKEAAERINEKTAVILAKG
ncbi:MAG: extracellular solute-binding protein, partial [Oscillospiraceae bacterium]|nr:extracellular solute-binding protein [Oscillospiraceae bacterium]